MLYTKKRKKHLKNTAFRAVKRHPENWRFKLKCCYYIHITNGHPEDSSNYSYFYQQRLFLFFLGVNVAVGNFTLFKFRLRSQILTHSFHSFWTFSPWLDNNKTSKCNFDSFPCMVTYMLCVEKCWNYISVHHCPPIAERLY